MALATKDLIVRLILENQQFKRELDKGAKKGKKANNSIVAGAKKVKGAYLAVAAALAGVTLAVAKSLKEFAKFEQTQVAFEVFLGSAEKATKVIGELEAAAALSPVTTDQYLQAGKALLAFGFNAETLTEDLNRLSDISSGTGKNFNELAVIVGKARVQNTLFAEDINQLTEAGIPVIDEFAKIMGVSASEVKKLGSQGAITFPVLEKALKNLTDEGGRFFELSAKQAKTLAGQFSTLSSGVNKLARNFGSILAPAAKTVVGLLNKTVDAVNELFLKAKGPSKITQLSFELRKASELLALSRSELRRARETDAGDSVKALINEVIREKEGVIKVIAGKIREIKDIEKKATEEALKAAQNANKKTDQIRIDDLIKLKKFIGEKTEAELLAAEQTAKGLSVIFRDDAEQVLLIKEGLEEQKRKINEKALLDEQKILEEQLDLRKKQADEETKILEEQAEKEKQLQQQRLDFAKSTTAGITGFSLGLLKTLGNINAQTIKGDEELARKQHKIAVATAVTEKVASLASIAFSTATAISKSIASFPITGGLPFSAIAAAAGIAQAAAVLSTPLPKPPQFQAGGLISGLPGNGPGNEDGIIAAQNGESVLNRQATAVLGEDAISALNAGSGMGRIEIRPTFVINGNSSKEIQNTLNSYFRQFGGGRGLSVG